MATSSLFLLASYLYNSKLSEGCGDWLHELNFAEHLEPVQRDGVKLVQRDDVLRVLIVHVNLAAHLVRGYLLVLPGAALALRLARLRIKNCYHLSFMLLWLFSRGTACLW